MTLDPTTDSLPQRDELPSVTRRWRWALISLCWLAWGLFHTSRLRLEVPGIDWQRAFVYALPDALLWTLLTPIPLYLTRRFPIDHGQRLAHTTLHLIAAVCVALAHSALDTAFNLLRSLAGQPLPTIPELFAHLVYYGFHSNFVLYLTIVGIAHYLSRVENLREEKRRATELRAQLSEARLEALRLQLRPHFLFNVLNTISGLMEQDPQTGQRVVRQLGELLRMSLSSRGSREITLQRELELSRAYLEIEQVRFQDRLTTRIEAPEELLGCAVPPLILQPILENAVRHGISPLRDDGEIVVSAANHNGWLNLRVTDNGPGIDPETEPGRTFGGPTDSTKQQANEPDSGQAGRQGIGIANTKARLQELYGDKQTLTMASAPAGGLVVTLTLPRLDSPTNLADPRGALDAFQDPNR